ncbi:MAG: UPF0149 family protein [Acidiferrobacterales bacterium]
MTETTGSLPDYDDVDAVLLAQGVSMSPAEVQGILAGVLCLPDAEKVDWLELILTTGGNVGPEPGKEFSELLLGLFRSIQSQLSDSEFGFSLLLPAQDVAVVDRAAALAAWCRGFLLGISATGLSAENCSDTVREILGDIVELSGIEAGQEEEAEAEKALTEIEEYLRVAARLLKEELGNVSSI